MVEKIKENDLKKKKDAQDKLNNEVIEYISELVHIYIIYLCVSRFY